LNSTATGLPAGLANREICAITVSPLTKLALFSWMSQRGGAAAVWTDTASGVIPPLLVPGESEVNRNVLVDPDATNVPENDAQPRLAAVDVEWVTVWARTTPPLATLTSA
jgi:hypothetical protein